jgi:hypothetical protein
MMKQCTSYVSLWEQKWRKLGIEKGVSKICITNVTAVEETRVENQELLLQPDLSTSQPASLIVHVCR